jgi:glycopeptide antibiotics resistance protein
LTPGREALENGAIGGASCDFARFGLVSLAELASFNDTSLNVLLFIPLGVVIGMIPGSRRKYLLALGAAAMPLAIEVTQMLLPSFDRTCESADVIDNLTGFGLGLIVGAVARPRFAAGQPGVPQGRSRARDDR